MVFKICLTGILQGLSSRQEINTLLLIETPYFYLLIFSVIKEIHASKNKPFATIVRKLMIYIIVSFRQTDSANRL